MLFFFFDEELWHGELQDPRFDGSGPGLVAKSPISSILSPSASLAPGIKKWWFCAGHSEMLSASQHLAGPHIPELPPQYFSTALDSFTVG